MSVISSHRPNANFCLNGLGFTAFKATQELSLEYKMNKGAKTKYQRQIHIYTNNTK